jgi:hypothetical protein
MIDPDGVATSIMQSNKIDDGVYALSVAASSGGNQVAGAFRRRYCATANTFD